MCAAPSHQAREYVVPDVVPLRRALLSLSDKKGAVELAQELTAAGVELLSTGGTLKILAEAGIPVRDVADYTGYPEMMDGRVKTLHPKIHGGILALRGIAEHQAAMQEHGILPIDAVIVNLYPFEQTVANPDVKDAVAIENIDIGGPSLIRGAAKNHAYVAVVTSPNQYGRLTHELKQHGGTTLAFRRELAGAAYALTMQYDAAITTYFARTAPAGAVASTWTQTSGLETWTPRLNLQLQCVSTLRYGENPHQGAVYYANAPRRPGTLVSAQQRHGKELSYNNLLDLDAAWGIVKMLPEPAAAVIKHNNPCGAATHAELAVAMRNAWNGDPVSAFGSVLGLNRAVDEATAELLCEPDRFVEAIIAPGFSEAAFNILTTKPKWRANVRLVEMGYAAPVAPQPLPQSQAMRQIDGGWLVQDADTAPDAYNEWRVATHTTPDPEMLADLKFAWAIVRHVKSNAIVLVKDRMALGVGAGQMSRVDAVEISIRKAGPRSRGAVLASDAFFPFADSIAHAQAAGITAVIQPGGSKRDDEVIAACDAAGIAMIFTSRRHFKH